MKSSTIRWALTAASLAVAASMSGCMPSPRWSAEMAQNEAERECRRLPDAGAQRDCMQRAKTLYAERDTSGKRRD
ncbi:MAG: hypothetical protein ACLGI6_22245 [Gammaproteobacteria bacterium]